MILNELYEMVNKDLEIDKTELDTESLRTPQIHNKYLILHSKEKLKLEHVLSEKKVKRRNKWLYYTGKMSEEDLERLEWEPFDLKILKQDLDLYLDSDDDLCLMQDKMVLAKEKLNYVESFIKELNNRHWKIRNAIEWKKFTNGVS